jgi:hypothetical protein
MITPGPVLLIFQGKCLEVCIVRTVSPKIAESSNRPWLLPIGQKMSQSKAEVGRAVFSVSSADRDMGSRIG